LERRIAIRARKAEETAGDYYKMLYADHRAERRRRRHPLRYDYFGTSRCMFATDAPFDAEQGRASSPRRLQR